MSTSAKPLTIAITGAAGHVGAEVALQAIQAGHSVIALDIPVEGKIPAQERYQYIQLDASDYDAFKSAVKGCDALVHLAAVFNTHDGQGGILGKEVQEHEILNTNSAMSYNALRIAAELGINRVVQASSVNTIGMIYSKRPRFDYLPLDENHPERPEDAYSLCKTICEVQANSIARRHPLMRIASMRFHWVVPHDLVDPQTLDQRGGTWKDLWGWVSLSKTAEAVLRALTVSENMFPRGHEAFFIVARTTCQQRNSLELLRTKYRPEEEGMELRGEFRGNVSFFDTSKAERMLGWKEEGFPMDG